MHFCRKNILPLSAVILVLALAGCASQPVMQDGIAINDPYEPANRRVHHFNKGVDARLAGLLPRGSGGGQGRGTAALANIGANLSLPGKVVNHLLQARPGPAIRSGFRFAVNSTLGLGGLLDPAGQNMGLPEEDTDFGQTLAVWGAGEGAYLELPLLGPSTQRDAAGRLGDLALDPLNHLLSAPQAVAALGLRAAGKLADRSRFGETVDSVLQGSADSYAQTRLIWLMHRRHELNEEQDAIDPYDSMAGDTVIDPWQD